MKEPYPSLANWATELNVRDIFDEFIRAYPQFLNWSGSHGPLFHHYGEGGLIQHTSEVVELGMMTAKTLKSCEGIDLVEFFLAALFHDTGKMYDYVPIYGEETRWVPVEHRRIIHHLPRSIIIWHDEISKFPTMKMRYDDVVIHDILAHHGRREAGSPVFPKRKEAWLLHLCDGLSARMNDAGKMDLLHHGRETPQSV